jgi:hypothetical protein
MTKSLTPNKARRRHSQGRIVEYTKPERQAIKDALAAAGVIADDKHIRELETLGRALVFLSQQPALDPIETDEWMLDVGLGLLQVCYWSDLPEEPGLGDKPHLDAADLCIASVLETIHEDKERLSIALNFLELLRRNREQRRRGAEPSNKNAAMPYTHYWTLLASFWPTLVPDAARHPHRQKLLRQFIIACSTPVYPEATTESAVAAFIERRSRKRNAYS